MRQVGSIEDTDLLAPSKAYISFFNSPYTGHKLGTAIDIYPEHDQWEGVVESPVSGRVTYIKKMTMGRDKEFPTEKFDYAIGIAPIAADEKVVRIMHCNPEVSLGDTIEEGDNLGIVLRSRYFNYWTGPHYHVEVLNKGDFLRSSKSYRIDAKLGSVTNTHDQGRKFQDTYHVEILRATKDNVIVDSRPFDIARSTYYSGLAAYSDRGVCGILDAGISHYAHGGIICTEDLQKGTKISFNGAEIGEVDISNPDLNHFQRTNVLEYIFNSEKIRGFSAFIYPTSVYSRYQIPLVLVPMRYGQFEGLQEGDIYELRVVSANNMIKAN